MKVFFALLALSGFLFAQALAKDFYKVLGLDKRANEKQIKTAYRKLSLKYHPDKNPNDEKAHEQFLDVGEAYETLGNPEKRQHYDQFGDTNGRQQQFDFGDVFGQFFGGQQGGRGGPRKGESTQVNVHVPLKDFFNGHLLEFDVEMVNLCEECKGTGSEDQVTHQCPKCGGTGHITVQKQLGFGMIQTVHMQCDTCGGKGNTIEHKCKHCGGEGCKQGRRHYDVYITPGQARDSQVVLEGEGDRRPGIVPGDLLINFREEFSKGWGFRRIKQHLYRTEVLTLNESIHGGWERQVRHLNEEEGEEYFVIKRGKGEVVIDGEIEVIKGKGMPLEDNENRDVDEFGDLFIEYRVLVPGASKQFHELLGKAGKVEHDEL